ncbi:hypothetical protein M5K25_019102 [Dendrobium thyrsiflorum]|uniref:Uncharacterized protein n=1 Tax=Dendrobium thyrsiflorum TaxID=117978 RepID=A0ABD0UKY7_DENTH
MEPSPVAYEDILFSIKDYQMLCLPLLSAQKKNLHGRGGSSQFKALETVLGGPIELGFLKSSSTVKNLGAKCIVELLFCCNT